MKKIFILLFVLLMIVLAIRRDDWEAVFKQLYSEEKIVLIDKQMKLYSPLERNRNYIGCVSNFIKQEKDEESKTDEGGNFSMEENPVINGSTTEVKPAPSSGNSQSSTISCKDVYVVDYPEQKEVGHYETIHHPEVTKTERSYTDYYQYCFYRDDGSTWIYDDFEGGFQADSYLNSHADEFCRYTFVKKQKEVKTTVVISEAYDEQIYVIDVPYRAEIGHYEKICE